MLVPIFTAVVIGILVGMLAMWEQPAEPNSSDTDKNGSDFHTLSSSNTATGSDQQRLQKLETELRQLKSRLAKLENLQLAEENDNSPDTVANNSSEAEVAADPLNQSNLVQAGVSPELASDIIRRLGEQEYQRMALRDRAIREEYFRTSRYFRELRELRQNQLSLREEIGDAAYERYLYQSGQNNRVAVSSVMAGSPAEQTGIQQGDVLLRYNNENVFEWNEIRRATSKGELGEYVTVELLRDGQIVSLMLPRGPLGVKLDTTRVEPISSQ